MKKGVKETKKKKGINTRIIFIGIIIIVLLVALYLAFKPGVRLSPVDTSIAEAVVGAIGPDGALWLKGEIETICDKQNNCYGSNERDEVIQAIGGQGVIDALFGVTKLASPTPTPTPTPTTTPTPAPTISPTYSASKSPSY